MGQYNTGPETIVRGTQRRPGLIDDLIDMKPISSIPELKHAHDDNYSMAANGALFRRDKKSMFAEVVDELFGKRKKYKTEMKALEQEREDLKHELSKRGIKL